MERDPVCQVDVDEKTAVTSVYLGETLYFCTEECKKRFEADPERYVSRSEHSQT
jgi:YHS domain-containing protein